MVESDKKRFAVILGTLYATFDREPNPVQLGSYFQALADLSIQQIEIAARKWIAIGKFFPKPIELREQLPDSNPEWRASSAWEVALRHAVTSRSPLAFSDPIINCAIRRLGGLDYFAQLGSNEANRFVRQRFIEEYRRAWANRNSLTAEDYKPLICLITNHKVPTLIPCDYQTDELLKIENTKQPNSVVLKLSEKLQI